MIQIRKKKGERIGGGNGARIGSDSGQVGYITGLIRDGAEGWEVRFD